MGRLGFKILVPVLLVTVFLQSVVPALGAGPSYNPGVFPGQWAKFGQITANLVPNPPPFPIPSVVSDLLSVNSTTITTQDVLDHNLSVERLRTYTNGTRIKDALSGNLENGQGNLTYWILAGDLSMGDNFWNGTATPVPNFAFNRTSGRIYLGVTRSVNSLNATLVGMFYGGTYRLKVNAFWDQITGVLLEFHLAFDYVVGSIHVASASANAVIVDSNIFGLSVRPDFFLYASPVPIVAAPGARGIADVFAVSVDNFAANVSLSVSFLGSDQAVATITPASVQASTSNFDRATLTVNIGSSVTPREYAVNLTGTTNGGLTHSIMVPVFVIGSLNVPDFAITADPAQVSFQAGSSGTSTIRLISLNGFAGDVNLLFPYVFCQMIGCSTAGLTPDTVHLISGGTATAKLTYSDGISGTSNFIVNATGGGKTHAVNVQFTVNPPYKADFALSITPGNLTIEVGKSGTATIGVNPFCCFTALVNFTTTAPSGITVQLSQNSVVWVSTVSLTITVTTNLAPGMYLVTLKAVGGSQSHTKTISIAVTAPPRPSSASSDLIIGLAPSLFYTIIAAIAAVTIVGGVLAIRMRKPLSPLSPAGTTTVSSIS